VLKKTVAGARDAADDVHESKTAVIITATNAKPLSIAHVGTQGSIS
jgi:hypothetical protein